MKVVFKAFQRVMLLSMLISMLGISATVFADVYSEYEVAGTETGYHTNITVNSRRTDHFLMRFGNQPREGFMQEHVAQGQLQFLEHVYDHWQSLGLRSMGGINATTKYKNVIKPHGTWDWDPSGTAVGFMEGPDMIPGAHIPSNALNYTTGNGCTPHEMGHGWQNQHLDSTTGGLPACQPQGFTESLANWVMSRYLGDYPAAWITPGATYGHAMNGYNCFSIFNYFMDAPGYGAAFINKLIFDPNLNSGANYNGDDIVRKAIRCDTSGAVDKAGAIRDGLGMMNAKMLDMDFWNHRVDRTYAYDKDNTWSYYQWNRVPMVKQPGNAGWYRPEWLFTPQQASNSYIPLTITASGSPRVVTCDFRPVSDAVRGTIFRACFVAFNSNKEPRYSKLWEAGENSFSLADDENAVYLAVFAVPREWNTGYMSNDYIADNVAMMPYRIKLTGANPKPWQWTAPTSGFHLHSNGGGKVADTATVDASAYVGPNAMVLGTAKVYGNSRIEDYAVVDSSATIGRSGQADNPVVSGHAYVTGTAQVYGHAKVRDYAWVWGASKIYDNAIAMAHTMLSGGSAFGNAILNQCPMRDTGLSFNGSYSGNTIRGGDTSGGGTYTTGVYAKWENTYTGDNKYQYLGYNFEKKSAIFAMDQYGLNHSFLMGEPQVKSDSINSTTTNVLELNGTSQYVELKPEAVDFADITVSAWVKWTGSSADQRIWSMGDGSTKYMYLTPQDGTTGNLRFVISNGTTTQYLDGTAPLANGTWTHVAVTLSGDTGVLYVNGTAVDTETTITIDPDQLHAALMDDSNYLGRGNAGNYFQGRIDEFDIYTKALTSTEVSAAMTVASGTAAAADTTAPTPNAATWLVAPAAAGDNAISMVATEGTDAGNNGVLYYFRCITDSTHDSGWISEPKFTDCKCTPGATYTYAVKMKDKLGNTGAESTQLSATAAAADLTAPTPNAPTFSYGPIGSGTTSITMIATQGVDQDELIMYKFSRVGSSATSGWSSSRTWTDTGLTSGASYSYTLQMMDSHGNMTAVTTSGSVVARDDAAPVLDSQRRLQWETEPYVRLDKTIKMSARNQIETAVDYYFECVENNTINSGWITAKEWTTPAMGDGTWTFRFKIRDRSPQANQSVWSATAQTKVLTTNCYHDYALTALSGLADSTLVRFTGKVTQVNADNYIVSTTDGLTSIRVVPRTYNCKTDTTLLNKNVTVKGHLWTYTSTGKLVNYAYISGNPASGKLEFETGDPIGASTNEAAPYFDKNASGWEGVNGWWTVGDAVEFTNVAAATEMTICYAFSGTPRVSLYINGTHARDISFPSTGANNKYGYKVETGLNIPAGATLRFQSDSGDVVPYLDYVIIGPTNSISGTVTDATAGGAVVPGAIVYFSPIPGAIANAPYTAITDASGNYNIRVPAGTWYCAAGVNAEVQIKSSSDQTVTVGPDATGVNFSVNWDPARTGKIEAETGKCLGIATAVNDLNASGGMVVSGTYEIGGGVEFSNIAQSVQMSVAYGYSGGTFSVYVNGVHTTDLWLASHTGTYGVTTIPITIPEHATVRFQHDTGDRDTQFDYVTFSSALSVFTINASAGTGGTISPSGNVSVNYNGNQTFTITPNTGYKVNSVTVDGSSVGAVTSYTFSNVVADHTISATFSPITYTVTASAGSGGTISPSGNVTVNYGGSQTFTITPSAGQDIANVTVDGTSVGAVTTYTFSNVTANHTIAASFSLPLTRNVPRMDQLVFSCDTNSFPSSGNTGAWPTYYPQGMTLATIASPTVETINGVKWERNIRSEGDGYNQGSYANPIACNGASVVMIVKPIRDGSTASWISCFDVFYDRLVVGIKNDTGQIVARRNGTLVNYTSAVIPDGQVTILSMIVQPDGTYKIFANGTQIVNETSTSAFTQMTPGAQSYQKNIAVGRNWPDGWSTFNGNIGDVFFYKVALTDAERQQLENDISAKFAGGSTITASAGTGGTISPAGGVSVANGGSQTFTITPNAGYSISDVTVDGVSQGAISTYTFNNVTANHTIAATFSVNTYTITASAGAGGTISPSGAVSVNYGANQTFTITPNTGFAVADVTVDGVSQGAGASYTFTNVNASHTISATFSPITFAISASAGSNGSISPSGNVAVNYGANQVFTITPNTGYSISNVTVDGSSVGAVASYTFSNVIANHTISATFAPITFTVTASAGTGGSISPSGAVSVNYDANQAFTITPNTGYVVSNVTVDGSSVGAVLSYTFSNVTANHTIAAAFSVKTYTITALAGTGGSISPSGSVVVNHGSDQSFTITPNAGYVVADVTVDGSSVGAVTSYTISNVTAAHTISATFSAITYTVTASAGTGGTISPSGAVSVSYGASQLFNITPDSGYTVSDVTVDGASVGAVTSYTFSNVTANHTISATFSGSTYTITASAGTGGTISPSGAVAVNSGANQVFTIAPNSGYSINNVVVDGVSQGAISSYTFSNVTANHTISVSFATLGRNVPKSDQLLFSAVTDTFPASGNTGNWATFCPSGQTLTTIGSPTVETIAGVKWEKNLFTDADGYDQGTYASPIPVNGASIVVAVRPTMTTTNHDWDWRSIVDIFHDRLDLGVCNWNGKVCVRRNGSLDYSSTSLPDGQITVLSLVVQSTGTYRVYANGTLFMDNTTTSAMTSLVPNVPGPYANGIRVGKGVDGWSTFNGNIGDVFVYKVALSDADRQTLEADLTSKFAAYDITASAGAGGSISPAGATYVKAGASQLYTITPNTGYSIADVTVDGASVGAVTSYTFTNVSADHTIAATFSLNTYGITASAGTGGAISPAGDVVVGYGSSQTFTITPNTGYSISNVTVDGSSVGAASSYTFSNVTANHTISATFAPITFTVTASAAMGGSINPSGAVSVNYGANQAFTITPNTGYAVADVTVDGSSVGAVSSYTFSNITANHTIAATFIVSTYTITASAGANGTIDPAGDVAVVSGANQMFTITPNAGYTVADVVVDGVSQGAVTTYTFSNVTAAHTISATFAIVMPTPLAFYQFENNVTDTQGAYNGTAYGTPTYVAGKVGSSAIQFNGSSQYVSITRPVSTNWTIAFWVKTTQTSSTGTNWYNGKGIIDGEVSGTKNDFGISYLNSKVAFGVGNPDTTIQSTSTINSGNWVHVTCTRNSTTGQLKLYVNGVLEATGTGPTGTKNAPNTLNFGRLRTGVNYFNGALDHVKIYSSVLTDAQVAELAGLNGLMSPQAAPATLALQTASTEPVIDLNAGSLANGELAEWANAGSAAGKFVSDGTTPVVEDIAGKKAVSFSGDDWMTASFVAPSTITGDHAFTTSVWAYSPQATAQEVILSWANNAQMDASVIPAGGWHLINVSYDKTNLKTYVDGVLVSSEARSLNTTPGMPVILGAAYTTEGSTYYPTINFTGSIGSVKVFDRALGQAEINKIFKAGF